MKSANIPSLGRNRMVFDNNVSASYFGYTDKMINFVENFVVSDTEMWKVFVEQFRVHSDTPDAHVSSANVAPYENQLEMFVTDNSGKRIYLTDYASAGKLWNEESKMAAWIGIKELYENN